jgi:hypothetical protein
MERSGTSPAAAWKEIFTNGRLTNFVNFTAIIHNYKITKNPLIMQLNQEVTGYINQAPEEQKNIMEIIRNLIHETISDTDENFKWSRPVFTKGKDFAYLKTAKAYVTLGFFNFDKLSDPDNLLEGTGKDMRHVKIKKADSIDKVLLAKWFIESV